MPSHFHISFGIQDFFRFTFKSGSRDDKKADQDALKYNDADIIKRNGIVLYDETTCPKPQSQPKCPLFTALPTEIRHIIYKMLLTTPSILDQVHKQLGSNETAMLDQYSPIPDIDAALLRTCRLVYTEALPILYGSNVFQFSSSHAVRHFQSHGLSTYPLGRRYRWTPLPFNFRLSPPGRLQLIRFLILELKLDYRPYSRSSNISYTRDSIWRDWSLSFFSDEGEAFGMQVWGRGPTGFPKLEKLTLDFAEWQLTENDGLLVKPFVKRLRPPDGLHELTLKGVKHPKTIEQFKILLLKDGSTFNLENH